MAVTWDGGAGDWLWTSGLNWDIDSVPGADQDLVFGTGSGLVLLNGNQTANSLGLTSDFTLGAYGVATTLTNSSGVLTVNPGVLTTINAALTRPSGEITLSGGGTAFLNNPQPLFAGAWIVDGAGTTLLHRQEGPTPQYNGVGSSQEVGRFDQLSLGVSTAAKSIILQNGGEYRIIGAGNNAEGGYKNIVIGDGGGTLNLAAGYVLQNLDDVGQIGFTTNAFTLAGKGRLTITGGMADANPLGGVVNVSGGILGLDRIAGGVTTAGTRFSGIAATGTTVNINSGGMLLLNSGTQGRLDVPTVNLNEGGILAVQGNDAHILGLDAGGTTLNVNGTASILLRDLFNPQQARLPRLRSALTGDGTLNLVPSANSGGNPRLVIERGVGSTFSGVFRLQENAVIEANPRFNTVVDAGKVLADGDVDFAGWGNILDLRDSAAGTSVLDYTTNNLLLTSPQAGSVARLVVQRATAGTGTGHLFNFGTLTMGNQRLAIEGNNSYQAGVSGTAAITGNAVIEMRSDGVPLVFSSATAITEDVAGRSLTLLKTGYSTQGARDVIVGGNTYLSNLNVATGTLQLRGNGTIGTGFGGAPTTITVNGGGTAGNTASLPTAGVLHLDNNTGHVVGATTVFAAANVPNRIDDTATLNLRGNATLRLTALNNAQSTETIGTTNVYGHSLIDVLKTGTATAPVALTLNTLTLGPKATANITGTSLGVAGTNTSRIVIPGTGAGFLSSQFHSGNEWAKYDNALDSGFELGVTPFVAADYSMNPGEAAWAAGMQVKYNLGGTFLTGNRTVDRLNWQVLSPGSINLNTSQLNLAQGGILTSGAIVGFTDGPVGTAPSGTAGITAGTPGTPAELYVYSNVQTEFMVPIVDNGVGGSVTFVKSGTGMVILSHQDRAVGAGTAAIAPYTTPTWSSTNTGGWVINDGMLAVHRGQYLGATPTTVTLNGGQLEVHEPVSVANDATILPGWGHHVVVNGNAMLGFDDNGESADANTGDRTLVKFGSLTINNSSIFGMASYSDNDIAFMGGATFNGKPTLNVGSNGRSGVNNANIISGVLAGSGFDVMAISGGGATLVLGGTQSDTANNTYDGAVTLYGATTRLNKANGFTAITDGSATEDVVINGGTLVWGPGQHGDLATTNNINLTNNGGIFGIAPTSPAAIKAAGMNQIADTANITLLAGTLGEGDRITNETFGTFIQKNGTFNVGLGSIVVNAATISGGAFNIDRSGSFTAGTLTLLPGAPDLNITTGIPAGAQTTLAVGEGGLSLAGQNITLGFGSSGNVMGSGGVLKLGGDVTYTGTDLVGGSYGRKGIFTQIGNTFRQLGNSRIDLMDGVRTFTVDTDSIFTVTAPMVNGGLFKSGGGALVLEPYQASTFAGAITVNDGILQAKGAGALGTSAGGVTINSGGTVKLDSGWTYGDAFIVSGPGALMPGGLGVREVGALVAESGTIRLTGAVTLFGDATLAGNTFLDPSVAPGAGGMAYRVGTLRIESVGGLTGSGTVTLSGHGDGVIVNGIKTTAGGVNKDGAGRWTISKPSTYVGATVVSAGTLRITDGAALGAPGSGTSVYGGGSLELAGGISVAEPLTLGGDGATTHSGAIVNLGGSNILTAPISLLTGATLRAGAGTLNVNNSITGIADTSLTFSGAGTGVVRGNISVWAPIGGSALTKNGLGTWTLAGVNTASGSTAVNGGLLVLNSVGTALDAASALNLSGGGILNSGTAQTVGALNLLAGGSTLGGGAGFWVGTIGRSAGATARFGGIVSTTSTNTDGILGGYALFGSNWATVDGGSNLAGYAAYTPLFAATATDNATASIATLAAAGSVNSLRTSGPGLNLGANNLTLTSGGLLYTGSRNDAIFGTGLLSGTDSAAELIVHTVGTGTLDLAAPIIGAGTGGLTKAGDGTLVLSGANAFTGPINISGGTLAIVGTGGNHPAALGSLTGIRDIVLNNGTFRVLGDYNLNVTAGANMRVVVGSAGGTLNADFGGTVLLDDLNEFTGTGDLIVTGGGRVNLSNNFSTYAGNVTVESGILTVANVLAVGGRQEQTITLKPGSAIINGANFALGQDGIANNIVAEGGVEFFAQGGNRVYGGDIQLSGTNTIALFERDLLNQERQIYFNGRVSGTDVTLDVFGANNGNPFYLASGSNDLTGTINLNPNAILEARTPGSLGINDGDVTVTMATNSRLLLRHFQNGDYHTNVVVNGHAEINSDRLANFAGGAQQFLTVNNLTVNGDNTILTVGGGNNYYTRVEGTMTLNGATSNILNVTASDLLLENGLAFGTPSSTLDKRGGFTAVLRQPTNHTGTLIIQGGLIHLQDNGALTDTGTATNASIQLRGGELRVDNSNLALPDRINDFAPITLGGGVLRITGPESLGTVTAAAGVTQIISNPISETVPVPLVLTGFTRNLGAIVQLQAPDLGPGAVGTATIGQARVSSRILLPTAPTLADTNQTIPGYVGNNALDFVQYSTTLDGGVALGFRDMRNPGSGMSFATNYTDNAAETAWTDSVILRRTNPTDATTVTDTLTANRALDAIKVEAGGTNRDVTIALGTFNLRIEGGGILDVGNGTHDLNITGSTGILTAGPATPDINSTAELVLGGTTGGSSYTVSAIVGNNVVGEDIQPVAVVKVGTDTVSLNGANTFSGGLYINAGTLNTTSTTFAGSTPSTITLAGGALSFNIASTSATGVDLGVPDHAVNVVANSQIVLDNGAGTGITTDHDITLGALTISGPYTLGLRSFDSTDASFFADPNLTQTHTFASTPTLDMAQATGGGNKTGLFTINGEITGSGFFVGTSGNVNDTASVLRIGGGEFVHNTYAGNLTLLNGVSSTGSNTDDLVVELNKADGFDAVTSDIVINGGILRNVQHNQIADTSNMLINQGAYDAFGKNETFASVTMRGGNFRTNSANTTPANTVTITGDFEITGLDDLGGSGDGVAANSNSTLAIDGILRLNGYSRGTIGGTASNMIVGGLEMTGTTLFQSGAGSMLRLNGDVTTFASSNTARLGGTTTVGAQVQINGTSIFNVADGPAGLDLSVSTSLRDSTSPAASGRLVKSGAGMMQLEGAGTANDYTGTTAVNEGSLVLWKSIGVNAIPAGALTIGDGTGGAKADQVIVRNNQQIADANDVTIASSGLLDLSTFNTSEQIGSLTGTGSVILGPGSALTIGGAGTTTFSGVIEGGGGAVVKTGTGTQTLTAVNPYSGTTTVNGGTLVLGNGAGIANSAVTVGGTGIGTLSVADGGLIGTASTGALTFGSTGIFAADIRSSTGLAGLDRILAGGNLSVLFGAQLALTEVGLNNALADATSLVLIDYTGFTWDSGIFDGYGDNSTFTLGANNWMIDYDDTTDGATTGNFVTLTTVPNSPYAVWAATYGLSAHSQNADSDQDGVKNLAEFAIDGNPLVAVNRGKEFARVINLSGDADGPVLTLTIPVRVAPGTAFTGTTSKSATRDQVTYEIQASADLLNWTTLVVTDVTGNSAIDNSGLPAPTNAQWEYRTFRVPQDASAAPKAFLRAGFTHP